jgi:hypothetical protein
MSLQGESAMNDTVVAPKRSSVSAVSVVDNLAIAIVPTIPIYTDIGSGADYNVAIYRPASIPTGWYYLGDLAVQMPQSLPYNSPIVASLAPYAVIVQPLVSGAISTVSAGNTPLWTDQHSGGTQDIEIWQFQPTQSPGYVPIGLFALVGQGYGNPPTVDPYFSKLAAINTESIVPGQSGNLIWNDKNSGSDGNGSWKDIALWTIQGTGVIPTNTFIAVDNYNAPPIGLVPSPNILGVA